MRINKKSLFSGTGKGCSCYLDELVSVGETEKRGRLVELKNFEKQNF